MSFPSSDTRKQLQLAIVVSTIKFEMTKLVCQYNHNENNPQIQQIIEQVGNALLNVHAELIKLQ